MSGRFENPRRNEAGWMMHCAGCGQEWEPLFIPADGSAPRGTHTSEVTGCNKAPTVGVCPLSTKHSSIGATRV